MEGMLIAQRWPITLILGPVAGVLLEIFLSLQLRHSVLGG